MMEPNFRLISTPHVSRSSTFDVPYFQVVCNVGSFRAVWLSPMLETESQAREAGVFLKGLIPDLWIVNPICFYSSANAKGREGVIDGIVMKSDWDGCRPEHFQVGINCIESILTASDPDMADYERNGFLEVLTVLRNLTGNREQVAHKQTGGERHE